MGSKYPFEYNSKEEAMVNYKELEGGFFPLGENNFWHGGIHLKGNYRRGKLLPVTPIFEGEIVAARISENYLHKSLPEKISVKDLQKLKSKKVDGSGNFLSDEALVKIANKKLTASIDITDLLKEFGSSLSKDRSQQFYILDGISDEERAAELLNLNFSNDYVLIKHSTSTPGGKPISFFSLYMHLKPYSKIIEEREKYKLFFYKKSYKTALVQTIMAAKLYSKAKSRESMGDEVPIPAGSLVTFKNDILFDKRSSYARTVLPYGMVGDVKEYIKVESQFNGKTGFINEAFCSPVTPDIEYTANGEIELYRIGNLEKLGKLESGASFRIFETRAFTYYKTEEGKEGELTFKEKGNYFHIVVDRVQGRMGDVVKLEGEKEGYIAYNNHKKVFTYLKNSKVRLKGTYPLYKKEGDRFVPMTDSEGKRLSINKGEYAEMVFKKNETNFDGDYPDETEPGKLIPGVYQKVVTKVDSGSRLIAAIKVDKNKIVVPQLSYIVDLSGAKNRKGDDKEEKAYSSYVELPFMDDKGRHITEIVEKESKLRYLGPGPEGKEKDYIKVESFLSGLKGYVKQTDCKLEGKHKVEYETKREVAFYSRDSYTKLGKIKKGVRFRIPKFERKFQDLNIEGVQAHNYYYEILVDRATESGPNIEYEEYYVRYKTSWHEALTSIGGGKYNSNGKQQLYVKKGKSFSEKSGQFITVDEKVTVPRGVHSFEEHKYIRVLPYLGEEIAGAIMARHIDFEAVPIYYKVSIEDEINITKTVNTVTGDSVKGQGYVAYNGYKEIYYPKKVNGEEKHGGWNSLNNARDLYRDEDCTDLICHLPAGTRIRIFQFGKEHKTENYSNIMLIEYEKSSNSQSSPTADNSKDIGKMPIAGLPIRATGDRRGTIIDIIESGTDITFPGNEEQFLARPYGFHLISYSSGGKTKEGYIDVGRQDQLLDGLYIAKSSDKPLPLSYESELHNELQDGITVVFSKPIPVTTSTHLGYPGTYLGQENILHLETFTDSIDFITPLEDKNGNKEQKLLYKIRKGTAIFHTKGNTENEVKKAVLGVKKHLFEDNNKKILPSCLFEDVMTDSEKEKFTNTRKIKPVAGKSQLVWLEQDEECGKVFDKNMKVIGGDINQLKLYTNYPKFKSEVSKPKTTEYKITPKDKVLRPILNSHTEHKNQSTYDHDSSRTWGDYRKIKIEKEDKSTIEGWILRDKENKKVFSVDNFEIQKTADVTFYDSCPLVEEKITNEDSYEELKASGYFIPQGIIVEKVPDHKEQSFYPTKEESSLNRSFIPVMLYPNLVDSDLSGVSADFSGFKEQGAYLYTKDTDYPIINRGGKYLEIDKEVSQLYTDTTEAFKLQAVDISPTEDFTFETWDEEVYAADKETKYLKVWNDKYILADDLQNSSEIIKLNYYNWADFGFAKIEDHNSDGLYDIGELCAADESLSTLRTKAPGAVKQKVSQLKQKDADILNRKICKHPTEWEKKEKEYFQFVGKDGHFMLEGDGSGDEKSDEIKVEMEHNKALAWWEDVAKDFPKIEVELKKAIDQEAAREADPKIKNSILAKKNGISYKMPDKTKLWYFQPLEFIEHLEYVTEINVRALIEQADKNKIKVIDDGKVYFNRKLNFKGMKMFFYHWGFDAIKDALNKHDKNWEETDLWKRRYSKGNIATVGNYAENMERMLKVIFRIAADSDVQREVNNSLVIGSTFRENDDAEDPGHAQALAIDLNGGNCYYCSSDGTQNENFDPDKALRFFELIAERYGVTQILFNCPYIIKRAKKAYVNCQYPAHHHHTHVDFEFAYSRRDWKTGEFVTKYNCKYGNYTCHKYYECAESAYKYSLKHDELKSKPD